MGITLGLHLFATCPLNRTFPWKTATVDCVYSSHVLEHLNERILKNFMAESYRVLKPGAPIRIVVPDLLYHAKKYVETWSSVESGIDEFLYVQNLSQPKNRGLLLDIYDYIIDHPHVHKTMYDVVTLGALISNYGFVNVVSSGYGGKFIY